MPALRERINRWRWFQKLYQDCAWHTEWCNGEEFERRWRKWVEKLKEMEKQGRLARRMSEAQREDLRVAREAIRLRVQAKTQYDVVYDYLESCYLAKLVSRSPAGILK